MYVSSFISHKDLAALAQTSTSLYTTLSGILELERRLLIGRMRMDQMLERIRILTPIIYTDEAAAVVQAASALIENRFFGRNS
jgi:hypothetical protein